jgi:hypothetical protein
MTQAQKKKIAHRNRAAELAISTGFIGRAAMTALWRG